MQAAGIKVKFNNYDISIFSIFFPPRHNVKCHQYDDFFTKIGPKFINGGDLNAKHPWWGSRLANPKRKELYKCVLKNNYSILST